MTTRSTHGWPERKRAALALVFLAVMCSTALIGVSPAAAANPPTADFTLNPQLPRVGETVQFTPDVSYDGSQGDLSYSWDFGDGGKSTDRAPTHVFSSTNGGQPVTVTLTVSDNQGNTSGPVTHDIFIEAGNQPPTGSIGSDPVEPAVGAPVAFQSAISDDRDTPEQITYAWQFGPDATPSTSSVVEPTGVVFGQTGAHHVTLTVTDHEGASSTIGYDLNVRSPQAPTADFSFSSQELNQPVSFYPDVTADGTVARYAWNFGDPGSANNTSSDPNPQHTYTHDGSYVATLQVTDDKGNQSDVATHVVEVQDHPPVASFTYKAEEPSWDPNYPQAGEPIRLTSTSTGGLGSVRVGWDLTGQGDFSDASGSSVTLPSKPAGTYQIGIQVTDSHGQTSTAYQFVVVRAKTRYGVPRVGQIFTPGGSQVQIDTAPDESGLSYVYVPKGHGGGDDFHGLDEFAGGCMPFPVTIPIGHSGTERIDSVQLDLAEEGMPDRNLSLDQTEHAGDHDLWSGTIPCFFHGVVLIEARITNTATGDVTVSARASRTKECIRDADSGRKFCPEPIDPQGVVYDRARFRTAKARGMSDAKARAAAAIPGAAVTLQRQLSNGSFVDIPNGDPHFTPADNPELTMLDGRYRWDVTNGVWRVKVSAPGYKVVYSRARNIPPEVTDLHVAMGPNAPPVVSKLVVSKGKPRVGQRVRFSVAARDLDGPAIVVQYDLGKGHFAGRGNPKSIFVRVARPGKHQVSRVFRRRGRYKIRIRVIDVDGASTVLTKWITVR